MLSGVNQGHNTERTSHTEEHPIGGIGAATNPSAGVTAQLTRPSASAAPPQALSVSPFEEALAAENDGKPTGQFEKRQKLPNPVDNPAVSFRNSALQNLGSTEAKLDVTHNAGVFNIGQNNNILTSAGNEKMMSVGNNHGVFHDNNNQGITDVGRNIGELHSADNKSQLRVDDNRGEASIHGNEGLVTIGTHTGRLEIGPQGDNGKVIVQHPHAPVHVSTDAGPARVYPPSADALTFDKYGGPELVAEAQRNPLKAALKVENTLTTDSITPAVTLNNAAAAPASIVGSVKAMRGGV